MPNTPGEIAYLAYRHHMARPRLVHWPGLTAQEQAAWEAAAEAVVARTEEEHHDAG